MFKRDRAGSRLALPLLALLSAAALALLLPELTSAATVTVTPESTASCYGSVSRSPTSDEPNQLAYKFHCDSRTTAYTLFIDRGSSSYDTIDDFSTTAGVFAPDGVTPNITTTWTCEGYTPGDSVNCNTGGGSSYMAAWNYAEGTFDPTAPYCKSLPAGAKPGTPAVPRALVQLVVSDTTGAEDGPFTLGYAGKCRAVPNKVPKTSKTNTNKTKTSKSKGST